MWRSGLMLAVLFAIVLLSACKTFSASSSRSEDRFCEARKSGADCDSNSECLWDALEGQCRTSGEIRMATGCHSYTSPTQCETRDCRWDFASNTCTGLNAANLTCRNYSTASLCLAPELDDQCKWEEAKKICIDNPAAVIDCPSKLVQTDCKRWKNQCDWDGTKCVAKPAAAPPPPAAPPPATGCLANKEDACKKANHCIWEGGSCFEKYVIPCHMFAQRDCESILNSGQCRFKAETGCKNINPVPCQLFKNIATCRLYPACQWRLIGWECYAL